MRYPRLVLWCISLAVVGAGYLVTYASGSATKGPTLAGVVEQSGKTTFVRVLFIHGSTGWEPFAKVCQDEACLKTSATLYPKEIRWSLWNYDYAPAPITTRTPEAYTSYIDQGLQRTSVPVRKQTGGTLASSLTSLDDPDGWRKSGFPTAVVQAVRVTFRQNFPEVMNCAKEGGDSSQAKPWNYANSAIRMNSSLASRVGWRLVQITLTDFRCDGEVPSAFQPQWFAVGPDHKPLRLNAGGMRFVGAADLDGHRKSEILFSSNDNGVAYTLFSPQLKELASVHFVAR